MSKDRNSSRFFITHSSKDKDFAKHLADDLRARGLEGFIDIYSIKPGDNIAERIGDGLEQCDVYIPVLSVAALKSPWCKEEINAAITLCNDPSRQSRPRIVPVLIEKCQSIMPVLLRPRLYVDFTEGYETGLLELLENGLNIPTKQTRQPLPFVGRRDPYTQLWMREDDDVVRCQRCGNYFLLDSWKELPGCALIGCRGTKYWTREDAKFISEDAEVSL